MDVLSITGLLLGLFAVVGGAVLKGAGAHSLVSPAAFVIVVVGTIAASSLQTPLAVMKRAMKLLPWILRPPVLGPDALIAKIVEWSNVARKQGLLGLEPLLEGESDPFLRKGLQLLVDGGEPDSIRAILEVEIQSRETADLQAAKVFEGMGIYAPTLGIIGAVLGLMAVMQNLADPSKLGKGIAAAFTATVYGIGLANLLFLPMANKLKGAIQAQSRMQEMSVEGLISIAQGENPRNIETRLRSFVE
jgi:chemotaxis protein MotA